MNQPLSGRLRNFQEYSSEFTGADLLLGNGFSMALWPEFSYPSLFERFCEVVEEGDRSFFRAFNTANFEAIQSKLKAAEEVNGLLSLPTAEVQTRYKTLQRGLVDAIRSVHPRPGQVAESRIDDTVRGLSHFGDVFTVSYDLLAYSLVMRARDLWSGEREEPTPGRIAPYNDYFWASLGDKHLEFRDFQKYAVYKHVYYLHGALFLFRGSPTDTKLKTQPGRQLLDTIASEIELGQSPLFVSEGDWRGKIDSINHSPYLRFAYDCFSQSGKNLVIFGTSLSEAQDKHIIDAISGRGGSVAYAVHLGERDERALLREIHSTEAKFPGRDLLFVDASTVFAV